MTPKEKAKELYLSFNEQVLHYDVKFGHHLSKQCALICVNELIKFNGDLWLTGKLNQQDYARENGYLFEVKQEIEKL